MLELQQLLSKNLAQYMDELGTAYMALEKSVWANFGSARFMLGYQATMTCLEVCSLSLHNIGRIPKQKLSLNHQRRVLGDVLLGMSFCGLTDCWDVEANSVGSRCPTEKLLR